MGTREAECKCGEPISRERVKALLKAKLPVRCVACGQATAKAEAERKQQFSVAPGNKMGPQYMSPESFKLALQENTKQGKQIGEAAKVSFGQWVKPANSPAPKRKVIGQYRYRGDRILVYEGDDLEAIQRKGVFIVRLDGKR